MERVLYRKIELKNFEDNEKKIKLIAAFVTIPFVLAVPPILGWFIGSWLDKTLDTEPYLMYVFIFFGIVSSFRECYRIIKKFGNGF